MERGNLSKSDFNRQVKATLNASIKASPQPKMASQSQINRTTKGSGTFDESLHPRDDEGRFT